METKTLGAVLVTGGAGFIGTNFVHLLVKQRSAESITVLDALTYAGHIESLSSVAGAITFVEGDIQNRELVDSLVKEADTVVHFAAESHNDNSFLNPLDFVFTNIVGTAVILEAVRRHGKRLHHVSTDEVYGALELDDPAKFTDLTPYDPSSMYSATKAGSDLIVRAAVRQFGIHATISNCSNNYGPYQHVEKFIPRQITNILDGMKPKLYGDGKHVRDWIHVEDHNQAVLSVLTNGVSGETYLIGANGERSNREILAMILDVMEMSSDYVEYVADRPAHDRRYGIDNSKLIREIGFEPIHGDIREGLSQTVTWYRENESWWRSAKAETESRYRVLGR